MTKLRLFFFCILCTGIMFGQSNSAIQKLEDFTKMYSVVRYFHPSDESANLNWDLFAAYGVEEVLKTKNQKEFEVKMKELFLPIAPSITFDKTSYLWNKTGAKPVYWVNKGLGSGSDNKTYIRQRKNIDSVDSAILKKEAIPVPEAYYNLQLSNHFSSTIPLIVYQKNGKTFPEGNAGQYKDLKPKSFDKNIALANMVIMWSGLRHFFPYQDNMKLDWDAILKEGLTKAYQNKSEEENRYTLRTILHYFNDGHMWVSEPVSFQLNAFSPGIKTTYLRTTQQLAVTDILEEGSGLKKGDVISKINGKEAKLAIDSLKQLWSGSDHYNTKNAVKELFRGKENTEVIVTLENGKLIPLKRNFNVNKNVIFFGQDNALEMQELRDKVLYVNLQNLKKATVKNNIDYIKSFDKIILDVRGYPKRGYEGAIAFYSTFFPDRNKLRFMAYPKIAAPFYDKISYTEWFGWNIAKKEELNAKVVLLISENCGSYQESISQYIKGNQYATLIGRTTGGVNGNINRIKLLNNMGYSFTGMKVRNPDGSLFHAIGVEPDIIVEDNLDDIKSGKDTFVEKAIEFLTSK